MSMHIWPAAARRAYTVAECAAITGLPTRTLYWYIQHGLIASVRLGGRILVPVDAIDTLLAGPAADRPEGAAEGGAR